MDLLTLLVITTKFLFYTGMFFSTGAVLFQLVFVSANTAVQSFFSVRKAIIGFASIGLIASFFSYALAAANLGGELPGMFDTEMLALLWPTPVGTSFCLQVSGFVLMLLAALRHRPKVIITAAGGVLLLASLTRIGHIKDHQSLFLQALLMLHLLGIAFWVGILLPLYRFCSAPEHIAQTATIARGFGRLASVFVPVLLLAGGWMAYQLTGSIHMLFVNTYGQTLLVKILVVAVLLGLAALNKWRFVPELEAGDNRVLAHLKKSVLLETVLIFLILFITAVLTTSLDLPAHH